MSERHVPRGVDTTVPNVARVYDLMLGGKDNFDVDREAFAKLLEFEPNVALMPRANRRWLQRVVRWLAGEAGIDQFLDLGSGLPTAENTHEVARRINPDAVVVYVDNDPVVSAHGRALLDDDTYAFYTEGDLTRPDEVIADPAIAGHLDLGRPIALLQCATMHFVPDQAEAESIVRAYAARFASGSYVGITHAEMPDPTDERYETFVRGVAKYHEISAALTPRTKADVRALFDGLELVPPGVVALDDWWPGGPVLQPLTGLARLCVGGVARKP